MPKKRRPPNRTATRSAVPLRLVLDAPPLPVVPEGMSPELAAISSGVADGLLSMIGQVRHPLDAELALASLFAPMGTDLDPNLSELDQIEAPAVLIMGIIAWCETTPGPHTLGLLRLLSDYGPAHCRVHARELAEKLTADGVVPPRWTASLGRMSVLEAWRYGDVSGEQDSVGVLFDYAHREHTVTVLRDYRLGGGIKDAWVATGRDARELRNRTSNQMKQEPRAFYEDIDARAALDHLRDGLWRRPCPVDPDQRWDTAQFLPIVHARARLLARQFDQSEPELHSDEVRRAHGGITEAELADVSSQEVHRLKVTIQGAKPPIWRRLEVTAGTSLVDFHRIVKIALALEDNAPFRFETGAGLERMEIDHGGPDDRLYDHLGMIGAKLDLVVGDGRLITELESLRDRRPDETLPVCLAGRPISPDLDVDALTRALQAVAAQ